MNVFSLCVCVFYMLWVNIRLKNVHHNTYSASTKFIANYNTLYTNIILFCGYSECVVSTLVAQAWDTTMMLMTLDLLGIIY